MDFSVGTVIRINSDTESTIIVLKNGEVLELRRDFQPTVWNSIDEWRSTISEDIDLEIDSNESFENTEPVPAVSVEVPAVSVEVPVVSVEVPVLEPTPEPHVVIRTVESVPIAEPNPSWLCSSCFPC